MRPHLTSLHMESEIIVCIFSYSSSFPIKMLATDAKSLKIEPGPHFFMMEDSVRGSVET